MKRFKAWKCLNGYWYVCEKQVFGYTSGGMLSNGWVLTEERFRREEDCRRRVRELTDLRNHG